MPHSLLETNLRLLDQELQELRDTAYFDQRIIRYIESLRDVIGKLTDRSIKVDDTVRRFVGMQVWQATQFIAGSAPRLQPYEMVYGLQRAINEWLAAQRDVRSPLVVTALIQEPNFYFQSVSSHFDAVLRDHLGKEIEYEIIQIKLPELYRRKPLYSVALYHELGHFLDTKFSISENVDVLFPHMALPSLSAPAGALTPHQRWVRLQHLREYFADLLAACYCGGAIKRFLEGFAQDNGPSPTHPATYDRLQVIGALLEGTEHALISAFNTALKARAQPMLRVRFERPSVETCFDAIRPIPLASDAEVFGVLDAAWHYLDKAAGRDAEPWTRLSEFEIERVINDLVEKSIRNRMILEQWNRAPPGT